MSAAAVQALVVLALVPAATVLFHRGIARDERRWRRVVLAERMARIRTDYAFPRRRVRLVLDTAAFTASLERVVAAMRQIPPATNLLTGRLGRLAALAEHSDLSPTNGPTEETQR